MDKKKRKEFRNYSLGFTLLMVNYLILLSFVPFPIWFERTIYVAMFILSVGWMIYCWSIKESEREDTKA